MLGNEYDIRDSLPFNLKKSSRHSNVSAIAERIFQELPIDKTKKVDLKKKCLVATIINLWISKCEAKYIRYSRWKKFYRGSKKRKTNVHGTIDDASYAPVVAYLP